MNRHCIRTLVVIGALTVWSDLLQAELIPVPNGSFETPPTVYADPRIDSWQKTPKPDWYNEGGGFLWIYNTGVFTNLPGTGDYIDNCDGGQGMWLFAVPEVGLFQDYDSVDWNDPAPTHDFDVTFEVGKTYQLAVGVIGTGGGMSNGVTLELSLYYRDAASNKVIVAATSVTNLSTIFSNNTHFIDCYVNAPTVKAGDPWAGEHIGIQFLSTVSSNMQGGYWDLDNVRLTEITPLVLSSPLWTNNQFQFLLQSETGLAYEILAATDLAMPLSNWSSAGTITNMTGTIPFVDTNAVLHQRYYRARQLP
jgi:hypothetical protein